MIIAADGMNQFLNTRNGDLHWGQEAWEPVNCVPVGELEQANRRFQSSRSDWEWQNNAILAHAGTGAIAGALPVDEAQYKMQQLLPSGSSNPAAAQTLFAAQPQQFSSFNSPFHPYPLLDPSHSHHSLSPGLSYPALSALSAISDPRRRFFDFEPVKRESFFPDLAPPRLGLNLGVRTYFSSDDSFGRFGKRLRANSPSVQIPLCQAEGCKADLSTAKHYHRRHKVCELHSKASNVIANGQNQRFCQQCSRFHPLAEFDEGKRSCRKRLADHNRRRRKPQPVSAAAAAESKEDDQDHPSSAQGTDADADDPKTASEEPVASNSKKSSSPTASGDSKTGSVGNSLQLNTSSSGVSSKNEHKGKIVNRNQSISASEGSNLATATSTIHASASSAKRQAQFPNEQESVYHQMLQDVCMQTSGPKLSLSSSTNNGSGCSISHSQSFNTNSSNIDIQMHSHPVSWLKPLSSRPDPNSSPNFHSIISNGPISNRSGLQSVDFMSDNLDNQQMFTLLENSSIRDNLNASNATSQHSRTPVEFLHQISSLNGPSNSNSGNADQHPGSKFDELQAWRPFGSRFDHSGSNIM